ncbi:MAG TPA: hypothetical protein VMX77_02065 [Candidatus Bathyarchaeia archaeon]|nr:hypothetical protein [Candidatus Bathyarchaeia archaeon]
MTGKTDNFYNENGGRVIALRFENHPGENPATIEQILKTTAFLLGLDPSLVGAGRLDAYQAVGY